ncbi:MAG: DMT family transporter [Bacteroidota bacterium]
MKNNFRAHTALVIANLLFGINYPVAKGLMPFYMQPVDIIIIRAVVSSLLFWVIHEFFFKEKTEKKDLLKFALCGLFGVSINQLLFFEGLNLSTPVDASIIMVSNPVMVMIFSSLLIRERMNLLKISGILLGAGGALITILYGKDLAAGSDPLKGNILLFINAMSYGIYLVLVKPLMQKYNPFTVMKWTFLFGFLFILPFSFHALETVQWNDFTGYTWFALGYVVIGTTFLAYLFIAFSMKRVDPTVASFYIYFQPVIAGVLAIIMYDEKISIVKIVSAIMIFTGVYFVSRKQSALAKKNAGTV